MGGDRISKARTPTSRVPEAESPKTRIGAVGKVDLIRVMGSSTKPGENIVARVHALLSDEKKTTEVLRLLAGFSDSKLVEVMKRVDPRRLLDNLSIEDRSNPEFATVILVAESLTTPL